MSLPKGLPLPTGITLVYAKAGNNSTAYRWSLRYVMTTAVRSMDRYAARLRRLGYDAVTGPGVNLTFPYRPWQVFACADRGCSAPKGLLDIIVAIPGG